MLQVWPFNPTRSWVGYAGHVHRIAFSSQGDAIAARLDGGVRIWSLKTGEDLSHFNAPGEQIALSPDGQTLATGSRLYSSADGHMVGEIGNDLAAFSPEGNRILLQHDGSFERHGVVISPQIIQIDSQARFGLEARAHVVRLSWSPSGNAVAGLEQPETEESVGQTIVVWDGHTGAVRRRHTVRAGVTRLAWAKDGELLALWAPQYSSSEPLVIRRLDADTGGELSATSLARPHGWIPERPVFGYALSSHYLAVGCVPSGAVWVYSLEDGSEIAQRQVSDVKALTFSPDERFLAVGTSTDVDVFRITWW